ncbi:MAG: hypothetical protein IPK79_10065 [Vampirovibrionales bacterium]|nr:hypothetical protein [Vampirovibrionales bacterium]
MPISPLMGAACSAPRFGHNDLAPTPVRHRPAAERLNSATPARRLWRRLWDAAIRWTRQTLGLSSETRGQIQAKMRHLHQELTLTRHALSETNMLLDSMRDDCFERRMAADSIQALRLKRLKQALSQAPASDDGLPPANGKKAPGAEASLRILTPSTLNAAPQATFESPAFGFKLLAAGQTGDLTIQGRPTAYQSTLQPESSPQCALERLSFWTKTDADVADTPGPDAPFTERDFSNLIRHENILGSLSDQELVDVIQTLRPIWETRTAGGASATLSRDPQLAEFNADRSAARLLLKGALSLAESRRLGMPFEAGLLADAGFNGDDDAQNARQTLAKEGFALCAPGFHALGMPAAQTFWRDRLARQAVTPTQEEELQLRLLKSLAAFYAQGRHVAPPAEAGAEETAIRQTPIRLYTPQREQDPVSALEETAAGRSVIWLARPLMRAECFDEAASNVIMRLSQRASQQKGRPRANGVYQAHLEDALQGLRSWVSQMQGALAGHSAHWAQHQRLSDYRLLWRRLADD